MSLPAWLLPAQTDAPTTRSTPAVEAGLPALWQTPLVAVSVANAVLFWVFVQALFDDSFKLRPWHAAAWLAVALLATGSCACTMGAWPALAAWAAVTQGLLRGVPLLFAVLAAAAAAAQWRVDLVEGRRRLRAYVAATVDVLLLLGMVLPTAWQWLGQRNSDLFPSALPPAVPLNLPPICRQPQRLPSRQASHRPRRQTPPTSGLNRPCSA